jgi:hypothetical protein
MLSEKQRKEVEALRQKVLAAYKRLGSTDKVAEELGISSSTARRHIQLAKAPAKKAAGAGRSLADFRAAHDKGFIVPARIKAALEKLGDGWAYEIEFCKLAAIGIADLANFRDQFADHVVLVERTKRVWAGTKGLAAKLREMVS